MTRIFTLLLLTAWTIAAQSPAKVDLLRLTNELDTAIHSGDWTKAVELSRALKTAAEDARNRSLESSGKEQVDSILAWLPADTETILVAQQPFVIKSYSPTKVSSAIEMAQGFVLGLLQAAEKGKLYTKLLGQTVRLAALGARRFGEKSQDHHADEPGAGLGMIPYQGCAVYSFAVAIQAPILARPTEDTILGYRVWISKGSQNDRPDRDDYLVSMLKPDVMLVCNSRAFFQETVTRVGLLSPQRALPADLPEWKLVDRSVPLWGITHYRNSRLLAALAPGRENLGAVGLTVQFGLDNDLALARMIAKADPWKEIVKSPDFRSAAKSSETAGGIWELRIAGKPDAAGFTVLVLMAELGFLILL
jgi:hypothetical protein